MSTNSELIRKADLVLSDIATAGKLNPEQTARFIRVMIDQPTLLAECRTVAMRGPDMKLNKIGFGSRILRPGVENTALSPTDRSKPTTSKVDLHTSEVIAEVTIPYDVLEDNIEGGNPNVPLQSGAGGLHQTIVDMIAERAALDLEELSILGDTGSGDAYLAMLNGFLKLFTSNVVDAAGATVSKDLMKSALKAMPTKYLRDRKNMKHFLSIDNETEMRDTYANRIGALADQAVVSNMPISVFGSPVDPVALMPGTKGLFVNPQNLIFGIQRNIMMEYDKDIRARQFIIVLTARIAIQVEQEDAGVIYTNISGT